VWGQINLTETGETLASIPGGHYTLHGLVREINSNLEENKNKAGINLKTNNSSSVLQITSEKGFQFYTVLLLCLAPEQD